MVAANFVSAVGQRFGRLLVVSEGTGKKRRVVAQCDCGTTKEFTLGERPSGLELDRIDNDGDYCKENCRWASRTEQLRNQRRTTAIEIGGETKSITEWAVYFGVVSASVASGRIRYGWEPRKAFTTPLRGKS